MLPVYGPDDELTRAIQKARARFEAMTPAEKAEMSRRQARSWGRAEAAFGSDADEAEYAAAMASGDPDRIAEVKRKEEQRLAAFDAQIAKLDPTP
jgi:hypothetical protein